MSSVRVIARVRPLLSSELDRNIIVKADGAPGADGVPTVVRIPNPKNEHEHFSFQFNRVYGSEASQQDIFDKEVSPTVKHLFNGFDVTVFAYGVTGTGKTYTMRGGKSLADRGVIPRMLSAIYRRCRKVEKDSDGSTRTQVLMSYYEIYNDKVFDLFEAPDQRSPSGLPLRDNGGKTVVCGLTERPCESLKQFEKLYDQANINRSTSATKLNAHSSRSHAVLCVKLAITTDVRTRTSTVSAIDLAGSEDNRRTDNNKERLVESACINKSLFVLAQCVEAISKKQSRIPYRESKMTRILSLGQNQGHTLMILNIAPIRSYHLDTISSLNFANRTKKIEVQEVENEAMVKGFTRQAPKLAGHTMHRQPLRPLAETSHNIPPRSVEDPAQPVIKRAKTFAVYADKSRLSTEVARARTTKRSSPLKRPGDNLGPPNPRVPKAPRMNEPTVSKAAIETMVEKKVAEILASRTDAQTAPTSSGISDEVKKRLEALEQRIENQGEGKSEGLTFLLMAKQHEAHGEDSSALRMYELSQEQYPDNSKLKAKIAKLQQRIQEKKQSAQQFGGRSSSSSVRPASLGAVPPEPSARSSNIDCQAARSEDDDFAPDDNDPESDGDFGTRGKPKRNRAIKSRASPIDEQSPRSPRSLQLLRIINSHDVSQIRLLRGVGAKKAEAIVAALCACGEDAAGDVGGGFEVESLGALGRLRGVGAKTVENMRCGLSVTCEVA